MAALCYFTFLYKIKVYWAVGAISVLNFRQVLLTLSDCQVFINNCLIFLLTFFTKPDCFAIISLTTTTTTNTAIQAV